MKAPLLLYPKDLAVITGKSIVTCRRMYNQILDSLGKTRLQGLSIDEYSAFTLIPKQSILDQLR